VSRAQLEGLGASDGTVTRWVSDAYLHRILPGVYAIGHSASSVEGDLAAVLLYAGPGAMLSHATAAWWFGLIDHQPLGTDVRTPRRCTSLPAVRVHDRRGLERVRHKGFPITTLPQTLLDLAVLAPLDRVRYALAQAEYHHGLAVGSVWGILGRGRPGSANLRKALARHEPRLARTRSGLERAFLALCERHQIPLPEINVMLEGWLVDAVWPEHRVVVELDGYQGHRFRAQLERDHERDLVLRAAGYIVVRYSEAQVTHRPARVAADLRVQLSLPAPSVSRGSR
jgi:very-short-patch-repair endonuclease